MYISVLSFKDNLFINNQPLHFEFVLLYIKACDRCLSSASSLLNHRYGWKVSHSVCVLAACARARVCAVRVSSLRATIMPLMSRHIPFHSTCAISSSALWERLMSPLSLPLHDLTHFPLLTLTMATEVNTDDTYSYSCDVLLWTTGTIQVWIYLHILIICGSLIMLTMSLMILQRNHGNDSLRM